VQLTSLSRRLAGKLFQIRGLADGVQLQQNICHQNVCEHE